MKLRGVNLGNWLNLEKWMEPELFSGSEGEDELDLFTKLSREQAEGGCYWSYKVSDEELPDAWDFRKCIKNGWLSYK